MFYNFINKYTDIFVAKNERSFCTKAWHIFLTKNVGEFQKLTFEILTKGLPTPSLVLKNRVLVSYHKTFESDHTETSVWPFSRALR